MHAHCSLFSVGTLTLIKYFSVARYLRQDVKFFFTLSNLCVFKGRPTNVLNLEFRLLGTGSSTEEVWKSRC